MVKALLAAGLLLLASKATDPGLVGSWSLDEEPFVEFKANGRGILDGDPFTWTAKGGTLTVRFEDEDPETMQYKLEGGSQLVLSMGGIPMTFKRIGKAPAGARTNAGSERSVDRKSAAAPVKAPKAPKAGKAGKDELSQLLLSSPWCKFSYNQITGASNSTRAVFFPDGTFRMGSQSEMAQNNQYGSYGSQRNSGEGGGWAVKNGQLHLSNAETGGQLVPVPMTVTRNSNGYPILQANGEEWSMCQ